MIRNILVPTDFSTSSVAALRYAVDLARPLGAALHVLHVIKDPFAPGGLLEAHPLPPGYLLDLESVARRRLDDCLTADEMVSLHVVLTTVAGRPAREILRRLHLEPQIDLVVMSTRGAGAAGRPVLGGVADKIIRSSPCPVLTLAA